MLPRRECRTDEVFWPYGAIVARGETVFADIGCTSCHVPELHLNSRFFIEPNPYNPTGTWADITQSFSLT